MKCTRADLIGKRFGNLFVVAKARSTKSGSIWTCRCDCGGFIEKQTSSLRSALISVENWCKSCELEVRSRVATKHGDSRTNTSGRTRLYRIWKGMRARCNNPSVGPGWKYYGGKGIRVCAEWNVFVVFRGWAESSGYRDYLTIERKDTAGNYEPSNCEWITKAENSRRAAVGAMARSSAVSAPSLPGSSKNAAPR